MDEASRLECKRCRVLMDIEAFAEHTLESESCELVYSSIEEHKPPSCNRDSSRGIIKCSREVRIIER